MFFIFGNLIFSKILDKTKKKQSDKVETCMGLTSYKKSLIKLIQILSKKKEIMQGYFLCLSVSLSFFFETHKRRSAYYVFFC